MATASAPSQLITLERMERDVKGKVCFPK